ncbi:hypothetical protein [Rhodosalinus sediminis]|uniref:hypothetical protein n=1 Tax=Rhodosalinus sediminis TaxID=1940533 RepID=UPI002352E56B|nr:hypothetical protein [Rhodosalinus sediminis]
MLAAADLHDPSAVIAFRAEAAARGACTPALDWLAYLARAGRTLADALAEAQLTQEGRAWCAWCREHLEAVMEPEVRRAFLAASLAGAGDTTESPEEVRAFTWSFSRRITLGPEERWLCLAVWHSGARPRPRRRAVAERREALRW